MASIFTQRNVLQIAKHDVNPINAHLIVAMVNRGLIVPAPNRFVAERLLDKDTWKNERKTYPVHGDRWIAHGRPGKPLGEWITSYCAKRDIFYKTSVLETIRKEKDLAQVCPLIDMNTFEHLVELHEVKNEKKTFEVVYVNKGKIYATPIHPVSGWEGVADENSMIVGPDFVDGKDRTAGVCANGILWRVQLRMLEEFSGLAEFSMLRADSGNSTVLEWHPTKPRGLFGWPGKEYFGKDLVEALMKSIGKIAFEITPDPFFVWLKAEIEKIPKELYLFPEVK